MHHYQLRYDKPTPFVGEDFVNFVRGKLPAPVDGCSDGWEQYSLPIGNGYFGVNVFGRVEQERLQVTENSLTNPYAVGPVPGPCGGLDNMLELYFRFPHEHYENFLRTLDITDAVATVSYDCGGVHYCREYFTSYPAKMLVCRFTASQPGALSFTVAPQIPFLRNGLYAPHDGMGKTGAMTVCGNQITLGGEMEYYAIAYEALVRVLPEGGSLTETPEGLRVENSDAVTVLMTCGTNYQMEQRVFLEEDPKKKLSPYPHPHEKLLARMETACALAYDLLKREHIRDYQRLFGNVSLSLQQGNDGAQLMTDQLLQQYKEGNHRPYLEELYFHYGRYLLIASSRPETYPANLQGTWNKYQTPPWSNGYWHNINVQMNYWPAFNTNLWDCFTPYRKYFDTFLPMARIFADHYIAEAAPEMLGKPGENGWTVCTATWLYTMLEDPVQGRHSGPGTGGFTAQLLWDAYDFTRDEAVLRESVYPCLREACLFFSKILQEENGVYLVQNSASPEQLQNGENYPTVGCAFDQQMVYECYRNYLEAAKILGISDELTETARSQIDHLEPALIGLDGQLKEYREEQHYGEIGEEHHRHISHLVGLYPGTLISSRTPELLEAAKVALERRGDRSSGWATAHRFNAWARTKLGDRTHKLLESLLSNCTYPNLWDAHPPFQIDGNFGGCSGIAEMLLQSHEGYLEVLPALPAVWSTGSFRGLTARGAFSVDAAWRSGCLEQLTVHSHKGCTLAVKGSYRVLCGETEVPAAYADGITACQTQAQQTYRLLPLEQSSI